MGGFCPRGYCPDTIPDSRNRISDKSLEIDKFDSDNYI